MKTCKIILLSVFYFSVIIDSHAVEFSGYIAGEGTYFIEKPLFYNQEKNGSSLAIQAEIYHEWPDGSSFTFVPFARVDQSDEERSHFDIRELNYLLLAPRYELRLGIGKVFWGATEFVHLVDVINQTDLVENIDEKEKLGQPMVQLTVPADWGTLNLFILPYFRGRTYSGEKGRFRSQLVVDMDNEKYESSSGERHVDLALRYSHTIGDMDFGIYHFRGTGREPDFSIGTNGAGDPVLVPFYEQINQTALDLQLVTGEWLWKVEGFYRKGRGDGFYAGAGGLEYTFYGIGESGIDLGAIVEYAYDDRGKDATTAYQNDAMLGLRLAFNDAAGSQILAAYINDIESSSRIVSLEGSRRFGEHVKATIEGRAFSGAPAGDPVYSLRDDDYIRMELAYYF